MQCYPLHITLHCNSTIEKGVAQNQNCRSAKDVTWLVIGAPPRGIHFVLSGILISREEASTYVANLRSGYCGDSCYPVSLSLRANVNMSLPTEAFHATALPSTGKKESITSPTASFWYTMYPIVQDHMRLKTSSPNNKPLNKKQL